MRQVNLVVADATLPDSGVKQQFLARYADDRVVQKAVRQVLDDMDQVAEVGSLLRVEERLRELLARAGHAAVQDLDATARRPARPGAGRPARSPWPRPPAPCPRTGARTTPWTACSTTCAPLPPRRCRPRPQCPALCRGGRKDGPAAGRVDERL